MPSVFYPLIDGRPRLRQPSGWRLVPGGLDVLIVPEEVSRVVLLLELGQAGVMSAVSRTDDVGAMI